MSKKIVLEGLDHFKDQENAMIASKPESTNTATVAHAVGEYFYWKGVLNIVTAAIAVGGTIQANTNVKPAVLADDVSDLKESLNYIADSFANDRYVFPFTASDLEVGIIKTSNGQWGTSGTRFCIKKYIGLVGGALTVTIPSGYSAGVCLYSSQNEASYIQVISALQIASFTVDIPDNAKYMRVTYAYSDARTLSDSDKADLVEKIKFTTSNINKTINEKINAIKSQNILRSEYYMDFKGSEITEFIPYKASPDANSVFISNGNLIPPSCTFYNNNGDSYDGVDNPTDSTRVRTQSFSIPTNIKYISLSGVDTAVATLVSVRTYDSTKNNLADSAVIINYDDYYLIKLSENVAHIHLLFGSSDNQVMAKTAVSSMQLMLNCGAKPLPYIASAKTEKAISAWDEVTEIGTRYNVYAHNVIWANNTTARFVYEKTTSINEIIEESLYDNYLTSKFSKLASLPDVFNFELFDASNVITKFDIDTTASDYMTEFDSFVDNSYVHKNWFQTKDASGTYNLYYYEFNEAFNSGQKPTVFIVCNQHGYEKNSAFTAYWLADALVNHASDNEMLYYLRNNVRFIIVPLANPWGFNAYNSSVVGTETGYTNYDGVNINRDYDLLTSNEAKFVINTRKKAFNPILSLDVHGYGSTRTSDDPTRIVWNSFNSYGDITLIGHNQKYLSEMSPIICDELGISNQFIGIITTNTGLDGGKTLVRALSDYCDSSFTFELPMRLPNESGEFSVNSQKISTMYLVNYLGAFVPYIISNQSKNIDNSLFKTLADN